MSVTHRRSSPHPTSHSSTPDAEAADTALVETQLLSELARAAESAMVPIPLPNDRLTKSPAAAQRTHARPSRPLKKRKLENEEDDQKRQNLLPGTKSTAKITRAHTPGHDIAPINGLGRSSFARKPSQDAADVISIPEKELAMASARHKRFASEEVDMNPTLESIPSAIPSGGEELEYEVEKEDDDGAPEIITATAGFEASRSAALDAARTARRQESALKVQRREKDARLKTRAQQAKSQKQPKASSPIVTGPNGLENNMESHTPSHSSVSKSSTKVPLPALLPDELLATEPVIQPPQVLLPVSSHVIGKKTKLPEKRQKGPKDIRRGNTIIRVLQSQDGFLPPKSSSTSKSVREKWLLGERGFLGAASVPRKKLTGSFARR